MFKAGLFMNFSTAANKEIRYDNTIDGEETENQTTSSGKVPITITPGNSIWASWAELELVITTNRYDWLRS